MRRAFFALLAAALAGRAIERNATNPPRCPACKAPDDTFDHGYLVTSEQSAAFSPDVWSVLRVRVCKACGNIFAAVDG
jgi:rubrerythrin